MQMSQRELVALVQMAERAPKTEGEQLFFDALMARLNEQGAASRAPAPQSQAGEPPAPNGTPPAEASPAANGTAPTPAEQVGLPL